MPTINFYTYRYSIEALYDTEVLTIGNNMLYQTSFELVKGTDNTIFVHVKNHDRKALSLPGKDIYAHLINQDDDKTYLIERLVIDDSSRGRYRLVFRKERTEKIPVGHYRLIMVVKNCEQEVESYDNIENLLYTGEDYNPIMQVHVVNNVFERFRKSHEIKSLTFRNDTQWTYSEAVDMTKLIDRDCHLVSMSVLTKRFVGDFIVECCYDEVPSDNDLDWVELVHKQFSIDLELHPLLPQDDLIKICAGYNWEDVDDKPSCFGFTFENQARWVRIKYRTYISEECPCEMKSSIEKVLIRS